MIKIPKDVISKPGENEIGYPEFIGVLVKMTVVGRGALVEAPARSLSPGSKGNKTGNYREYNVKAINVELVKKFFAKMKVRKGVLSVIKTYRHSYPFVSLDETWSYWNLCF